MKTCLNCGAEKPDTSEYFRPLPSGNLRAGCRACEAAYAVEQRERVEERKINKLLREWAR